MSAPLRFSRKTAWETHENPLASLLKKLRDDGGPLLDLTQSNPTHAGFDYLKPELLSPFSDPRNLSYEPDPRGLENARAAVCRYYEERGLRVLPEQVFLTSSTSEAYFSLFRLLADPGDRILIPKPGYPLFDYLCGLSDLEPVYYPLVAAGKGWRIGPDLGTRSELENVRAAITVNPNNPTGSYTSGAEASLLSELCGRIGAAVISDEVFWDYPLAGGKTRYSFAENTAALTFTLSGISKILGLPQMKLSWIIVSGPAAAQKEAMRRLEVILDTTLPVNTPVQHALAGWLASSGATDEILGRVRANLECAAGVFGSLGLPLERPEGGWYILIDLPGPDEEWALEILREERVYTHPGFLFDFSGRECLVVSLLPEETVFREGIRKIAERLAGRKK